MSEVKYQANSREQIVATLSEFASIGNGDPDSLDSTDPRIVRADTAFVDWVHQERSKAREIGTLEAELLTTLSISTVYIDAGFTNPDYLDEVINDWLVQDEQRATDAGLIGTAEKIQHKRLEFNSNIRIFRR